jgi:biopolymer transport protein ExbB/TolQ
MWSELSKYINNPVTLFVIGWLVIYLFLVFFIFFYRYFTLKKWIKDEKRALNYYILKREVSELSFLWECASNLKTTNPVIYDGCIEEAKQEASSGLTFLGIVASTAPFIGLFGTVVGILTAFANLKDAATLQYVAPAIADALIATAIGILVAVPAYSFHQILDRKVDELIAFMELEKDAYLSDETRKF